MGGFWGISVSDMAAIAKTRALGPALDRALGPASRFEAKRGALGQQHQVHAAVLFALILDLTDLDAANFGGAGNMGSAAGL